MTNKFDDLITRRGTGSYKWDEPEGDDIIPMWVADMDFRVARPIMDALRRRVEHGVFGYTLVTDEYIRIVSGTYERVQLDRLSFDQNRLKRLDPQPVQRRRTV